MIITSIILNTPPQDEYECLIFKMLFLLNFVADFMNLFGINNPSEGFFSDEFNTKIFKQENQPHELPTSVEFLAK